MIKSLFSQSKQRILGLLFLHPERQFYLREIMRLTGVSQGTLHRELKPLVRDGILVSEKRGNQVFYSVNKDNPIYGELRGIVIKTFGIVDVLRTALKPLAKKIKFAFLYGSVASSEETARSDIDLMIIGKLTFLEASVAISKAEEMLGRTVNPTIYPIEEFRRKLKSNNHFVNSVINTSLIFLIGEQDDLRKLAGK